MGEKRPGNFAKGPPKGAKKIDRRAKNAQKFESRRGGEHTGERTGTKRKVAVLIGYNGVGYSGSQVNPGVNTIEGDIFAACVKAGAVSEDNAQDPTKISLLRAARTDAGVHAGVNVLSMKLVLEPKSATPASGPDAVAQSAGEGETPGEGKTLTEPETQPKEDAATVAATVATTTSGESQPTPVADETLKSGSEIQTDTAVVSAADTTAVPAGDTATTDATTDAAAVAAAAAATERAAIAALVARINSHLVDNIRIWDIIRVQASFDPRYICDMRQYEYTLPTYVFIGPRPGTSMHTRLKETYSGDVPFEDSEPQLFWKAHPESDDFAHDITQRRTYRAPASVLERAREWLRAYEGNNNFHNYTSGKHANDKSAQRIMREITLSEPFIEDETEYVTVRLVGQSFMLNQIRKMVGVLALAVRSLTPVSIVQETYKKDRLHTPRAPALGLLLCQPVYNEYNRRVRENNENLRKLLEKGKLTPHDYATQLRDEIGVSGAVEEEIERFKREKIRTHMRSVELKERTYAVWLNYLDVFNGPDFAYFNNQGIIPEECKNPTRTDLPEKLDGGDDHGAAEINGGKGEAVTGAEKAETANEAATAQDEAKSSAQIADVSEKTD